MLTVLICDLNDLWFYFHAAPGSAVRVAADVVIQSLAALISLLLRACQLHQDAFICHLNLRDLECVHYGVNGGVSVREEDADVKGDNGHFYTCVVVQRVHYVQREPTNDKQNQNQSQRIGQFPLLTVKRPGLHGAPDSFSQLFGYHIEE